MSATYCIRMPLKLPAGFEIKVLDPRADGKVLGYAAELTGGGGAYVLTVKGIGSEEQAGRLLHRLHTAVCWASLDLKTGITASREPQAVHYSKNPDEAGRNLQLGRPVDAIIDAAFPAIYPENTRLAILSAGSVRLVKSVGAERLFRALGEGLEQTSAAPVEASDETRERIETAIELYLLSHFEPNTVPRFLLQCTALEVLAPPGESEPPQVVALVEGWVREARTRARDNGNDETEGADFKRLADRVGTLKAISHSQRIRRFANGVLTGAGLADANGKVQGLMRAYDARGRFLHDGQRQNIGTAATAMNDILPILLQAVLKQGG